MSSNYDIPYDSTLDTLTHSRRVDELLLQMIAELQDRVTKHDLSKIQSPEKEMFDEFSSKLKDSTYNSEEYKGFLRDMPALPHHYANNRHHPEFGETSLEWKPLALYEGYYEVSNFGDVRSVDRIIKRSGPTGNLIESGQILKGQLTPKGYVRVQLVRDGVRHNFLVHRLVAGMFLPNPEGKPEVNHLNGVKHFNHVSNLEWATESENLQHAYDTGLKEGVVKWVVHCPELDITTFGTNKMETALRANGHGGALAAGVWNAMDSERKYLDLTFEGTLLAEWRRNRIASMTLVDIAEMLCDWKAAGERHANGSMQKSFEQQKDRFNIDPQVMTMFENTAVSMGWL